MSASGQTALGILITQDLFFGSKVTGTASALGYTVETAHDVSAAASKRSLGDYRCIIVDLACPGIDLPAMLNMLPKEHRPTVIAFGAHVDADRLRQARDAGCDEVMPRSKFSGSLPDLLTKHLGT